MTALAVSTLPALLGVRVAGPAAPVAGHVHQRAGVGRSRRRSAVRRTVCRTETGQRPQWLPAPGLRHPGRDAGRDDLEAAVGVRFPGLAAGTPSPRRGGADQRGGDLIPARGLDPADGEARGVPRHHPAVTAAPVRFWEHDGSGAPCLGAVKCGGRTPT